VLRAAKAEPSNADHASESSEDKGADQSSQAATRSEAVRLSSTQPASNKTQAVHYGNLLLLSRQIADDPASQVIVGSNIQAQVRAAMDNLVCILESHGLATSNILSVMIYMREIDELPKADAVYEPYFRHGLPAHSVVRVDGLPKGSLIEISVIAGK
jgi:2-iminobutanoate/2-iminopropanoate deaminase